jgi:hypothetical protein
MMQLARRASLASVLLLFTGCISHGPVGSLPHIADPEAAATLVIARPSRFVGAAGNVMATLDGRDVFGLGNGEHISVQAPPGEHLVGVASHFDIARTENTVSVMAEARRRYYFQIDITLSGVRINRISPEAGEKLVAETQEQRRPGR